MSDQPSSAFIDTLYNLIAPGKRVRLSPFIEAAQAAVLLGRPVDEADNKLTAQTILKLYEGQIQRIADRWAQFQRDGKRFAADEYCDPLFLDAYLVLY